ncbi:MAG: baseplate J/gp47 family protein [Christensenellales bacterium]|jgi:phage-related baseplate assembly protein
MSDFLPDLSAYPDFDTVHFNETDSAKIYSQIIKDLEKSVKEPLYPGDERRIYAEALAALFVSVYSLVDDAARQKMLRYARGNVLDALGERTNASRLSGSPASTIMRFTVSAPRFQNIVIPQGTRLTPDGAIYFSTAEAAVLQSGSLFVDILAESAGTGMIYNGLPVGAIGTLVDMIPYISSVANLNETSGGDDGEPYDETGDSNYRERIRISAAKLSTAGPERSYEYHARTANPNIASVSVASPEPGHVLLVPLMRDRQPPSQDVLDQILEACNAFEVRPLTDYVQVQAPSLVPFEIEFKYYVTTESETAAVEAIEGEGGAIAKYIDWQAGAMGRDINPDQLRRFVLTPGTGGALRMDVVKPAFQVVDGLSIASFSGVITVSHEVVSE